MTRVNLCVSAMLTASREDVYKSAESTSRGVPTCLLPFLPSPHCPTSVSRSPPSCHSLPFQNPAMRAASVAGLVLASLTKLATAEDLLFYNDMLYNEYKEATDTLGYTG
jgi:hypothetical protein